MKEEPIIWRGQVLETVFTSSGTPQRVFPKASKIYEVKVIGLESGEVKQRAQVLRAQSAGSQFKYWNTSCGYGEPVAVIVSEIHSSEFDICTIGWKR